MKTEPNQEDRAILEALAGLNRDSAADSGLVREYTELFALLAYEEEPAAVPARLWEEIREGLAASSGGRSADARLVPFPDRTGGTDSTTATGAAPPRAARWAPLALAAALAVCLVGMGYLLARTESQQSTIARLESDLGATSLRQTEMVHIREQFEMITRVARHVYPMRSASERPEPVNGKVFVCGQHQQWYLNVQGLETPPEGYEYCLWFVTDEGMVMGGAVEKMAGGVAELSAQSMPVGTRGFAVTLEEKGRHDEPEGDVLLLAEEAVSM